MPSTATCNGSRLAPVAAQDRWTGCARRYAATGRPAVPRAGGCGSRAGRPRRVRRRDKTWLEGYERWCAALREVIDDGVTAGLFTCADPEASVVRVSALLDGLSVATLVYRTVSRPQLRRWVAEAVAHEVGIEVEQLL